MISKKLKFAPFYLLSALPLSVLHGLSNMIFFILYYIVQYRKKVVTQNLNNAFPNKTKKERNTIRKKFYLHFCDVMIESLKMLTISETEAKKRFRVNNPEIIQQLYNNNKSIILYSGHYANFEWLAFIPLYTPHKLIALYRKQSSSYFNDFMLTVRNCFGMECVEAKKGYKAILKHKKNNTLTMSYVVGDQRPKPWSSWHNVQFLNQNTPFLVGADRIAKKSNQVVIFPYVKQLKRGYYELDFKILEDNITTNKGYELVDKYAKILEQQITEAPEFWFWTHKRWATIRPKF